MFASARASILESLKRVLDVSEAAMIPVPSGVRVWLSVGRTDMRRGMNGLALQVQETIGRDPFAGDLFVFRGPGATYQDPLA